MNEIMKDIYLTHNSLPSKMQLPHIIGTKDVEKVLPLRTVTRIRFVESKETNDYLFESVQIVTNYIIQVCLRHGEAVKSRFECGCKLMRIARNERCFEFRTNSLRFNCNCAFFSGRFTFCLKVA